MLNYSPTLVMLDADRSARFGSSAVVKLKLNIQSLKITLLNNTFDLVNKCYRKSFISALQQHEIATTVTTSLNFPNVFYYNLRISSSESPDATAITLTETP